MELRVAGTVDIAAGNCEIISYSQKYAVLAATNPAKEQLNLYAGELLGTGTLAALDCDLDADGVQGVPTAGEATSVAVHPYQPVALAVVLGGDGQKGRLMGVDIRAETRGRVIIDQQVGYHPDSIGISPDGRWALIACEAEGNPETPGSIWAVDLAGLSVENQEVAGNQLPGKALPGLGDLLGQPVEGIEPEFVAFDPAGRFAVVSCQDNDAIVLVDMAADAPELVGVVRLSEGSQPDGVDVIDGVPGPDGTVGCLIAVAEEGGKLPDGSRGGNSLGLIWLDVGSMGSGGPGELSYRYSSVRVGPLIDPDHPDRRRDPEAVRLVRLGGALYCLLGIERGDVVMCFDLASFARPTLVAIAGTGSRPESMVAIPGESGVMVITANEGDHGRGGCTFLSLTASH